VRVVVSLRARSDIPTLTSPNIVSSQPIGSWSDFSQRFDELCEFPFLGPDRSELRASLRGLLMDGYIAFYVVETDRIVIVRVIDGRMNIKREMST
jgi:toxin ParE1/3/4